MTGAVIGISCYVEQARWGVWDLPAALLPGAYLDAVSRAGGVPVLLPPVPGVEAAAARLDGLVLAGGPDVDPVRYGADPQPQTEPPRPARDAAELALLEAAETAGLPVLAVCRGLQLLNVSRGGSLLQHLPDSVGHQEHNPVPGVFGRSEVRVVPGSRLAFALIGGDGPVTVACHHHQAVDRLGAGLSVVAAAADGTVEAIEDASHAFLLGVQWHPEVAEDAGLFRALVEEAAARA